MILHLDVHCSFVCLLPSVALLTLKFPLLHLANRQLRETGGSIDENVLFTDKQLVF